MPTASPPGRRGIAPEFSLYLDLVRIAAAGLVLLEHTNLRILSDTIPRGAGFGHSAVVVFFVLSGFVISYVVSVKEQDARTYAISRISRLYSVVLPALVLAITLDTAGRAISPSTYIGQAPHDLWWVRALATLFLMNEPWGISITAFSAPFWSISYEGWYYILFGVFMFWTGRWRWTAITLAALLCGPKILLLFPIWLGGVYLHRGHTWSRLGAVAGLGLFWGSLASLILFHWAEGPAILKEVIGRVVGTEFQFERMTWSSDFLGDYVIGLLVLFNFAGFRAAAGSLQWLVLPLAAPIRWAASFTFSLYLYHRTFILFYIACLRGDTSGYRFYFSVLALTVISVYLLGLVTEHQKSWFRQRTEDLFHLFERRRTHPQQAPALD